MSMQLRKKRTDLHMDLTLILQLFQLFGGLLAEGWRQVLRINLVQAGVKAKSALLERSHFLKAQRHVVHGDLDQEPVLGVLLELEPVEKGLRFLKETERALILLLRNEVDGAVVEFVQYYGDLIFV